jgi:hypothetical protein
LSIVSQSHATHTQTHTHIVTNNLSLHSHILCFFFITLTHTLYRTLTRFLSLSITLSHTFSIYRTLTHIIYRTYTHSLSLSPDFLARASVHLLAHKFPRDLTIAAS